LQCPSLEQDAQEALDVAQAVKATAWVVPLAVVLGRQEALQAFKHAKPQVRHTHHSYPHAEPQGWPSLFCCLLKCDWDGSRMGRKQCGSRLLERRLHPAVML